MIQKLLFLLEEYLNANPDWHHIHSESIGEVELRSPWREDTWRHSSGFFISHWHNVRKHSFASGPVPNHIWSLSHGKSKEMWTLTFQYGRAPE